MICGDRNWRDPILVLQVIRDRMAPGGTLIEGGAKGADRLARQAAEDLTHTVLEYPAKWSEHGRAAGPIRNRVMLEADPEVVWAFHDDLTKSKGTADMISAARKKGVPVILFSHAHPEGEDIA